MKTFMKLSIIAVILFFGVHTEANAYVRPEELVDVNGTVLKEGDLISASTYEDPDIYIINFGNVPGLVGYGELPDAGSSGYKRLFLNPVIFSFYGHLGGFRNVHHVTPRIRDAFITSGVFRNCETNDPRIWATEITGEDSGTFHHVQMTGEQAAAQDPFFFFRVFCINSKEEAWYPKSSVAFTNLAQVLLYARQNSESTYPTITSVTVRDSTINPYVRVADVSGYLPTPCYTLIPAIIQQSGFGIFVFLHAIQNVSGSCIQVIQNFTTTVDLHPGPYMPVGNYTLTVNGVYRSSFVIGATPLPTPGTNY